MRVLFLDDSYTAHNGYLGYGGFAVADELIRELDAAISNVKKQHGVPQQVELKWSPPSGHFLRTKFSGVRHDLYLDVLKALEKHGATVLCAVHGLNECYGVRLHNWSLDRAARWAATQQLRFLAERFEDNVLLLHDDHGLLISDRYGHRVGESDLIRNFSFDMIVGTDYNDLARIAMPPLMADSRHTNLIQAADVVTGIIVGTMGGSKYGVALFPELLPLFARNPHHDAISFCSSVSVSVDGFGLKLFPSAFRPTGVANLKALDDRYLVTQDGWRERPVQPPG